MNKKKNILKVINQNKTLLAIFSVALSLFLIVGSTYSWITYSDEQINQSKSSRKKLSAEIEEVFTPNLQWVPGASTEKKVLIRNNGQIPVIIRVSVYEFLAQFELDMSDGAGNGNLKIVPNSSGTDMTMSDSATWKKGNTYKLASGKYYKASEVYKSDKENPKTAYVYKGNRTIEGLKYLKINFFDYYIYSDSRQPATGLENYWFYSEGYFYYSEILEPGDRTRILIRNVSLDKNLPNKYKGSLYQLVPVMDAHDITKALMEDWKISPGSHIEAMYREKVH
ncbi:BsaA family SipW-dependent biofilm matrix protein [Enterococcus sp. 5H]|uniref:BsaA family SipW-dependent biofilm matrix protein n=1 Tax=Enterococcus sp. 5H TaxID=1229490 RepID=UPI002304727E|nr:BsaA family SipW-dependent biofilm matrix protein [Enterococcus sp. 5H]MDA9471773.1 hypothetical protein [Enterococcus sp. 5H]